MNTKFYRYNSKQFLAVDQASAWEFFSSPRNLALITPSHLNFKILNMTGGDAMAAGKIIQYRVTVFPLVRVFWETEITEVSSPHSFTDTQRKGPYSSWIHKHTFIPVQGGIEMIDDVVYSIPLGLLGRIANKLFVANAVAKIFQYRFEVLHKIFNENNAVEYARMKNMVLNEAAAEIVKQYEALTAS